KSNGTERVDILNQLTYELISRDNVRAMQYCQEAIELSQRLKYDKGQGIAHTYRGVYEYLSGEFSNGRSNLLRGLALSRKAGDRHNQAYTLLQLGNSYLDQAKLDSSLFFFNDAHDILKDSTDPVTLGKLYRNMSMLYQLRSENDLRDEYMIR